MAQYIYPNTSVEPEVVIFFLDESCMPFNFKKYVRHPQTSVRALCIAKKVDGYLLFRNTETHSELCFYDV